MKFSVVISIAAASTIWLIVPSYKIASKGNLDHSRQNESFKYHGFDFRHPLEEVDDDKKLEIVAYFRRLEIKELLESEDLSLNCKLDILRKYEFPLKNVLSDEICPMSIRKGGLFDDWKRTF